MLCTFKIENTEYRSLSCLMFGDYGGAGAVGRANIDSLLEIASAEKWAVDQIWWAMVPPDGSSRSIDELPSDSYQWETHEFTRPELFLAVGDYASEGLYVRADIWDDQELDCLTDYPCLDDEKVSEIEMQWEQEALESWAFADLNRDVEDDIEVPEDVSRSCYHEAMEVENQYPVSEHNGSHIPVDEILPTYTRLVLTALGITSKLEK
tara:strand:- start:84 stop:707 length:624 start_codon:yes stop_codon:yes gene_type:complete